MSAPKEKALLSHVTCNMWNWIWKGLKKVDFFKEVEDDELLSRMIVFEKAESKTLYKKSRKYFFTSNNVRPLIISAQKMGKFW